MSFEATFRLTGNVQKMTKKFSILGSWYEKIPYFMTNSIIFFIFPCDDYFLRYYSYFILFKFCAWENFGVVTLCLRSLSSTSLSAWYQTLRRRMMQTRWARPKILTCLTKIYPIFKRTVFYIFRKNFGLLLTFRRLKLPNLRKFLNQKNNLRALGQNLAHSPTAHSIRLKSTIERICNFLSFLVI